MIKIMNEDTDFREPSDLEYGEFMNSANNDKRDFINRYEIKVINTSSKTEYSGTVNDSSFVYIEKQDGLSSHPSYLDINDDKIDLYNSYNETTHKKLYKGLSIYDVVDMVENPENWHIEILEGSDVL